MDQPSSHLARHPGILAEVVEKCLAVNHHVAVEEPRREFRLTDVIRTGVVLDPDEDRPPP